MTKKDRPNRWLSSTNTGAESSPLREARKLKPQAPWLTMAARMILIWFRLSIGNSILFRVGNCKSRSDHFRDGSAAMACSIKAISR